MSRINKIFLSILIIALVSILQPYFVLITQYGPSSECGQCLIIEQTFVTSLIYLFLPLTAIFLITKTLKFTWLVQGFLIIAYFVPISFIKLTIPLFKDRIASWSTFSDEEIWDNAIIMSIPSLILLSGITLSLLGKVNRHAKIIK